MTVPRNAHLCMKCHYYLNYAVKCIHSNARLVSRLNAAKLRQRPIQKYTNKMTQTLQGQKLYSYAPQALALALAG